MYRYRKRFVLLERAARLERYRLVTARDTNGERLLYDLVLSLNVHRRHLTTEQKRELIDTLLKRQPEMSDRHIGNLVKADNKTVATRRAKLEGREEIPHVETRTDSKGRKQPAKRKAQEPANQRKGGYATIVSHCAVFGERRTEVRKFTIDEPTPCGQYPVSVTVSYVEQNKRKPWLLQVVPDNLLYVTIERGSGAVIYDSRNDVPCDMEQWKATNEKHAGKRPGVVDQTPLQPSTDADASAEKSKEHYAEADVADDWEEAIIDNCLKDVEHYVAVAVAKFIVNDAVKSFEVLFDKLEDCVALMKADAKLKAEKLAAKIAVDSAEAA